MSYNPEVINITKQSIAYELKGVWIAGELLTWRKSIAYDNLSSEYMIFGAMKGNRCLAWDDVCEIADIVGLPTVRVMSGTGNVSDVIKEAKKQMDTSIEGFVIRPTGEFQLPHYTENVAKFVGSHHSAVATSVGKNGIIQ